MRISAIGLGGRCLCSRRERGLARIAYGAEHVANEAVPPRPLHRRAGEAVVDVKDRHRHALLGQPASEQGRAQAARSLPAPTDEASQVCQGRRIEEVLLDTVVSAGMELEQIDAVVTTGGSSNIPLFTGMLARLFGKEKVKESNAFSSVVAGLAIKAYN